MTPHGIMDLLCVGAINKTYDGGGASPTSGFKNK